MGPCGHTDPDPALFSFVFRISVLDNLVCTPLEMQGPLHFIVGGHAQIQGLWDTDRWKHINVTCSTKKCAYLGTVSQAQDDRVRFKSVNKMLEEDLQCDEICIHTQLNEFCPAGTYLLLLFENNC